jgi:hypothetical protein
MQKKINPIPLLILSLTLLLSACQLPFSTGAKEVLATQTPIILIATDVPSSTSTPVTATVTATLAPPTATATETQTPTETVTETSTSTATLTKTPPPTRAGGLFYAAYMPSAPVIDGVWDEWSSTAYSANAVVYGGSERSDSTDLDASLRIGWDWHYLYLAVKIHDDVYAQHASGQNLYLGDSLELLFDAYLYDDFYSAEMTGDDYEIGISPGNPDVNGSKEAVAWYPRSGNGSRNSVVIGSVRNDGVTRVEVAIPWGVLGVSPYNWAHYGFAFSVSDNDNTNENLQQSMVSCVPGRKLLNPTTWGELILSP